MLTDSGYTPYRYTRTPGIYRLKEGLAIAILSQRDADKVKQALDALAAPVKLLLFTAGDGGQECETCDDARNLFTEVAALSDKVTLEEHQLDGSDGLAGRFNIDKVPALVLTPADGKDTGIRFYGLPVGYEFATLLEDLSDVAKGKTRLSDETRTAIAGLTSPVRIQVFVTPT